MKNNITYVSCIVDTGRSGLTKGKREYSLYINLAKKTLEHLGERNAIIYADDVAIRELRLLERENIQCVKVTVDDLKSSKYYPKIEKITQDEQWLNYVSWLKTSPQAVLPLYNALVYQKLSFMHNAVLNNMFNNRYFLWIDIGLHMHWGEQPLDSGNFKQAILPNLEKFLFLYFSFKEWPRWMAWTEMHGMKRSYMESVTKRDDITRVVRAGMFGGTVDNIPGVYKMFDNIACESLDAGEMGTEESIYTIMSYIDNNLNLQEIEQKSNKPFLERLKL